MHYYFPSIILPAPIPRHDKSPFLLCHENPNIPDSSAYDRLNLINSAFYLWDYRDPNMVDAGGNRPAINNKIARILRDDYDQNVQDNQINIFYTFPWRIRPSNIENDDPIDAANSVANLGVIMTPWIDQVTKKAFCPTQKHYDSDNPVFNVLGRIVGADTEGLYVLRSDERKVLKDPETGEDIIPEADIYLFRETVLRPNWFVFVKDGSQKIAKEPTEDDLKNKAVFVYYPFAKATESPYVKKSDQVLLQVLSPEELVNGGVTTDLPQTIPAPDKRFGCIPKASKYSNYDIDILK